MGELYIKVMGDLGVEISSQKTHRSAYFFEFAKRYFYREDVSHKFSEITPFPISALRESSKRSFLLTQLLLELEGKS